MSWQRLLLLGLGLCVVITAALFVGPSSIVISDLLGPAADPTKREIFLAIRVPRVLCGLLVGGALALCGVVYQAIFRNPLACPFSVGVSGGASCGAAIASVCAISWSIFGVGAMTLFGALGALVSVFLVLALSHFIRSDNGILLCGIVLTFFWGSIVTLLQYIGDYAGIFKLSRWMMGSLQLVGYHEIALLGVVVGIGTVLLLLKWREIDLISCGDEFAASKGVEVEKVERHLFIITSIMVGTIVSLCGVIGFIGIIVPQICKFLSGASTKWLAPTAFVFGAVLLLVCDAIGRVVIPPNEVPVGVFTALLGGPFFLWLLVSRR